jgi:hypothetical protein
MTQTTWKYFIDRLSSEIEWNNLEDGGLQKLEALMQELFSDPRVIADLLVAIPRDCRTFADYLPHMEYPRPVMDKFVLHMDPNDRFRVRMHRFKTEAENRGAEAWVHDHRWHYSTLIVSGTYEETVYDVTDEPDGSQTLTPIKRHVLTKGMSNSLKAGIPHLTTNPAHDEPCLTLFVRGPSITHANRVYDNRRKRFQELLGRPAQIRREFENMSQRILATRSEALDLEDTR